MTPTTTATATVDDRIARLTQGRGVARFGFLIGVAATLAGNVAASFLAAPGDDAAAVAASSAGVAAGAVAAGLFWPGALVVCVEVILRVQWPEAQRYKIIRVIGLNALTGIVAWISFGHLWHTLGALGYKGAGAVLGALAPDALMLVCGAALLAIGDNLREAAATAADARRAARVAARQAQIAAAPATAPARHSAATEQTTATEPAPATATEPAPATDAGRHAAPVSQPRRRRAGDEVSRRARQKSRGLALAAAGKSAEEITAELGCSLRSAQRYVAAVAAAAA